MVRFSSDTGPVKPVSGIWQKAQASLRYTDKFLSYSISLTEQFDLLDLIVRRRRKPLDRLRFDAVNLGLDLRNFLERLRRELRTSLLRTRRIRAQRGDEDRRCDRQERAPCLHFGTLQASAKRRVQNVASWPDRFKTECPGATLNSILRLPQTGITCFQRLSHCFCRLDRETTGISSRGRCSIACRALHPLSAARHRKSTSCLARLAPL